MIKLKKFIKLFILLSSILMISCQTTNVLRMNNCTTNFKSQSSIYYINSSPESFQSRFLKFGMSLLGMKNRIAKAMQEGRGKQDADEPSRSLKKDFIFTIETYKDRKIWTIAPKQKNSEKVILYLHGGAYINNIIKYQWDMIEEIAIKTNAKIVVPDYPLAPESQYDKVYLFLESVYNDILQQTKPENIIFLGDSAGGGLSLGLAQKLQVEKKLNPSQIILIAPWLDITMSDPEIQKIDAFDKLLNVKGLIWAGEIYAGKQSKLNSLISPIYGNLKGLGKISIFIGTHDILYADSLRLKKKLEENQISFHYFEYPKMFHVWPVIVGMQESDQAIDQISNLIVCD